MNIDMKTTKTGINIPPAILEGSGFDPHEGVKVHALSDCVVFLKKCMNAPELIRAAWALFRLSSDMVGALMSRCDGCGGQCGFENTECPYCQADFALDLPIPEEFRELAGLSEDAVLHAEFPEDGTILLRRNGGAPGLWDVPAPMMEGLLASGVCPGSLEEFLKSGEAVYGNKEAAL